MMYFYWQKTPESGWNSGNSSDRASIIKQFDPPFCTVLDLDLRPDDETTQEEFARTKWTGDLYFDLDSDDVVEVTANLQRFLDKLEGVGVDLNQVELAATGGKGYHILIPQEVFMAKPAVGGIAHLPSIYKEIAYALFVDNLDMRVYSARKGRMWRTYNVQRPKNGKYKVSISLAEARGMTAESYTDLTSSPRVILERDPPTYTPGLAVEFSAASDKVTQAMKRRSKSKKDDELVAKFKGGFPGSMKAIMDGTVRAGVGFQRIATQLAITAHSLGTTQEEFLASCAGLIEKHESDGNRYDTAKKRWLELRRMYDYMDSNPCYNFSVGGLKSCLPEGFATPEFDGGFIPDPEPGQYVDDGESAPMPEAFEGMDGMERMTGPQNSDSASSESDISDFHVTQGLEITQAGIWKLVDGHKARISVVGFTNPCELVELKTGDITGYEVDSYLKSEAKGKRTLYLADFQSKSQFQKVTMAMGASVNLTDSQVASLIDIIRMKAEKNKKGRVLIVTKEGIDIVTPHGEAEKEDIIYASKDSVISMSGKSYRLKSLYNSMGEMRTDIHHAQELTYSEDAKRVIWNFLKLNSPTTVARCLGWYLSAFISPIIRREFEQYPLLQIYGNAGAGKSQYSDLLMRMHYYVLKPKIFSAGNMTAFALDATLNSSSSIPVVFDEMKPRELPKLVADKMKMAFRNNYNSRTMSKGKVDKEKVKDSLATSEMDNRAPLCFIGEALESQTAIVDRAIIVSMSEQARRGTGELFDDCMANRKILSQWGRSCLTAAMMTDVAALRESVEDHRRTVRKVLDHRNNIDRPAFNYAVVLTGLDFGRNTLRKEFGSEFDEIFETLKNALLGDLGSIVPKNISESSKVLSVLAHLSKNGVEDRTKLVLGEDYVYYNMGGETCVDLKLRPVYDKYRTHVRSLGEEFLFDTFEAFTSSLREHSCIMSTECIDNISFKKSISARVFRFHLARLLDDGVEEFKPDPRWDQEAARAAVTK